MFDERRKYDSCIFCGSTAGLTKEHIFGKGLAKRFGRLPHWTADSPAGTVIKGSGPILSVAPAVLCKACNNPPSPLATNMEASIEPLQALVEGKKRIIGPDERAVLERYWQRVGFIVDVVTSNHHITDDHRAKPDYKRSEVDRQSPPIFSDAERRLWAAGGTANMTVHVGHHLGVLGVNPVVQIAYMKATAGGETRVVAKRFVVAIGQLVVCLAMGAHLPRPIPPSMRELGHLTEWPTGPDVTYDDFFAMPNPSKGNASFAAMMSNSLLRELIEAHCRKTGTLDLAPEIAARANPDVKAALIAVIRQHGAKLGL